MPGNQGVRPRFLKTCPFRRRAKVQQKKFIREMERRKQDANVLSSVARSMTSRNRPLERTGAHLAVQ